MKKKTLNIIKNDPWLEPYTDAIVGRHNEALNKEAELCGPEGTLESFANAHNFFGLHHTADGGWSVPRMGTECHCNHSYRRFFQMEDHEEICP